MLYFSYTYVALRDLHSFPTRRSSDLSGLTPSQLYVFMPPNLGGFFMVRSYYPSECHADYFDFERIEAQSQNNQRDRKSGSAGMPRPISYAVFCLKKQNINPSQLAS